MLGYTQIESRVAYLGVDVDDAIQISENLTSKTDRVAHEADMFGDAGPIAIQVKPTSAIGMFLR